MKKLFYIVFGVGTLILLTMVCSSTQASTLPVSNEPDWQNAVGTSKLIGFEEFLGSVTNQYPGVAFGEFNGGNPYSADIFPYKGTNSMFTVVPMNYGNGGWMATFATPVNAVAFWSQDVESAGSRVYLYDSSNYTIGDYELMGSGGGHGAFLYGFNGYISDSSNIAKIAVAISGPDLIAGDAVWFDNFQYSTASEVVPEPTSLLLLGSGLGMIGLKAWRRRK